MDPLELLPQELWRMIFEKVEDGQDWLNLYRASPTFEGVVGEERTLALLTKVFPLVRKHLSKDHDGELLPFRLVSKHWKKAVDTTLLEPSNYEFGKQSLTHYNLSLGEICWNYSFRDSDTISKFLDKFCTHPGNPFIGHGVRFCFGLGGGTEEMKMEYRHSVQRLMDKFGNQIRKLSITYFNGNRRPGFNLFVDEFRSCVTLAPNLEELNVLVRGAGGVVDMRPGNPQLGLLGDQAFPIISKLKMFFFAGDGNPESLVNLQNILIRLTCNPDSLKTTKTLGVPLELTTFPNLETATVVITRLQEDVSNLMDSSWPLTRLTMCPHESLFGHIPLEAIVECMEHFKETLTSLWIGDHWGVPQPTMELRLELPRLKYLIIHYKYLSLHCLQSLPSLEMLRIFGYHALSEAEFEQLFKFMEAQLFSEYKLWEMLPKLRKVEVIRSSEFSAKSFYKACYREKLGNQ